MLRIFALGTFGMTVLCSLLWVVAPTNAVTTTLIRLTIAGIIALAIFSLMELAGEVARPTRQVDDDPTFEDDLVDATAMDLIDWDD